MLEHITVNRPWRERDFPLEVEGHRVDMDRAMLALIRVELHRTSKQTLYAGRFFRMAIRLDKWIVQELDRRGIAPRRDEFIHALRKYAGLK